MKKQLIILLVLFLAFPQASLDLFLPSLPHMQHLFHTSSSIIQLTIPVYVLAISLAQFNYGPLSDSFGRKPVVIFGLCVFIIGSLTVIFSHHITTLLLGRFIQGFGMGFGALMARAILRDVCEDKKLYARIVNYQYLTWASVPMLAPVLGGYIEHYAFWQLGFYLLLIFSIGILIFVLWKLPETKKPEERQPYNLKAIWQRYFFVFKQFDISAYTLIVCAQYWTILTTIQLSPFIFQNELNFNAADYGWIILLIGAASFAGGLANRTVNGKFKLESLVSFSILIMAFGALLMIGASFIWFTAAAVILPLMIIRFMAGMNYSNCVSIIMDNHPHLAGTISAFLGLSISFTGAVATGLVAHVPQHKQYGLTACIAVEVGFMALMLAIIKLRKRKLVR